MIEPARPHELAPLVADACCLTEREREVTRLVTRGLSTETIAVRRYLSRWTVQDHVRPIPSVLSPRRPMSTAPSLRRRLPSAPAGSR
jgi:DNA-binding NarL/FixJ family response regulator